MPPKKKEEEPVAEPPPSWADEGLDVVKESGVRGVITSREPWQIKWEDADSAEPVLVWTGTSLAAPAWAAHGVKVVREDGMLGWITCTKPWKIKWQDTNTEMVENWTVLKNVPKSSGHFVLLNLDPVMPLDRTVLGELCAYVEAFFGRELKVVDVLVTPTAPECPSGWEALKERCNQGVQSKPGRDGSVAPRQLMSSDLLSCIRLVQDNPNYYGVETDDAEWILGITLNEFYHDPYGLRPEEPCPEDRTKDFFIRKDRAGVCSMSQLEFHNPVLQFTSSLARSCSHKLPRQIFKPVTNSFLSLLGLRNSDSHQCCAYRRPFQLDVTPLQLSIDCEEALLKKLYPGTTDELITSAAERYNKIRLVLTDVSDRLKLVPIGHRKYREFEEEIDWMQIAEETLTEIRSERFRFTGTEGPQNRRRSFHVCLLQVHERQCGRTLHRTMSEPLIKRTCLLDMTKSAPYRHESGDLHKWTNAVWNKQHRSGGHYVETGGTLRPKTIGTFVASGLNASLVQKMPTGHLPKNLEDLSDHKLGIICGQHRLENLVNRAARLKAVEDIMLKQSMRETRLNRRQFYGTDLWRKEMTGSTNPEVANAEVPPRGGDRQADPEDWRPMRSRKNASSMSYTTVKSFSASAPSGSTPSLSATAS